MGDNLVFPGGLGSVQTGINDRGHPLDYKPARQENLQTGADEKFYSPFTTSNNNSHIKVLIPAEETNFIQLDETQLYLQLKFVELDGTTQTPKKPESSTDFSVVDLLGHSLFSDIVVKLNNVEVCKQESKAAAFKAFLEANLSFNRTFKQTLMKTWGGYGVENETAELHRHSKPTGTDAAKKSYSLRAAKPISGDSFHIQIPIFHDLFQSKKFLPPGISISIEFTRMPEGFFLMCSDATMPKIKCIIEELEVCIIFYISQAIIEHISFQVSVKTCSTTPDHVDDHNAQVLSANPFFIPFVESNLTFLSIPKKTVVKIAQVVNDIMPFTLIAGFVPDSAIACSSEVNPYVFERNHLDKIEWLLNGKPIAVRSMDISKDKGLRAYNQFMKQLTLSNPVNTVYIPFEDFMAKYFLLSIDFTGDACSG